MKKTISYILFVAIILRLVVVNQSFWLDEATSGLVVSNFNFREIITDFSLKDFHPPLYYLVLKIWSEMFGTWELSLRALSILFGVLTVFVIYKIVQKEFGNSSANIAALLMATSPLHIYYSQEARMYSMATFFVVLSVNYFLNTLKSNDKKNWILFVLSVFIAIATDYLTGLMIPVFLYYAYVHKKNKKWYRNFVFSGIFFLALTLILLPLLQIQLINGLAVKGARPDWWNLLGKVSIKNILLVPVKFIIGRISLTPRLMYAVFVFISLMSFGFVFLKSFSLKTRLYLYWIVIPYLFAIIISFFIPVLSYFRLLFIMPAFCILLSQGLEKMKENLFLPFFGLLLCLNFFSIWIYARNPNLQREDWRGLTRYIREESKDHDLEIVFVANSQMEGINYYWSDAPTVGPDNIDGSKKQIWLLRYVQTIFDPKDTTRDKIESMNYLKESEHSFNGIQVWKYNKNESSN